MKTLLLYSGGLDSTVLLYYLLRQNIDVTCLTIDYQQRHVKEIESAKNICDKLSLEHIILEIPVGKYLTTSSQTSDTVDVPYGHFEDEIMKDTFVPNRNMMFVSIGASIAIDRKYDSLSVGAHRGDYVIYPDCRESFYSSVQAAINIGNYSKLKIYRPFIKLSKNEVIDIGKELNVLFNLTWSCYEGKEVPCKKCGACIERGEI